MTIASSLDICPGCLVLLANGDYDPELTEAECEEYSARIDANWDPTRWSITLGALQCDYCTPDDECESTGFSMAACDLCRSTGQRQGGGERYHATAWPISPESSGYTFERLVYTVGSLQADLARAEFRIDELEENRDELETDVADLAARLEAHEPPTAAELAARMAIGLDT